MNKITSLVTGAMLAALLLGSAAFAVVGNKPVAQTNPATGVVDHSATLTAEVKHAGSTTTFRFEYGPTTSYGQSTAEGTLPADDFSKFRPASARVSGLTPETLYHFRVRATNDNGTGTGDDRSFTTTAAGTMPGTPAPSVQAPLPQLGSSVLIAPLQGTIKVKRRGAAGYTTLKAGESVPVGSLVDTRRGTVKLTSSLGSGKTQSGEFRGGLFKVRQARTGRGMTDLVLRGASFASCPRTASPSARHKRRSPKRRLFGRDEGGRFRTHGRNSVATVRGTSWVTTDTCAGTRTTVKEGAVSVRDRRRGKTVLVRAGHSYLARSAR